MKSLLRIEGLRVDIPTQMGELHAVRGVDIALDAGETLCLVGESGCGKSLTALALMGLLPRVARRSAARFDFFGEDLSAAGEPRMSDLRGNRLSMIFQDPMTSLNPSWSIGNQLEECWSRHRGGSASAARERALYLLGRVGISAAADRLGQYPHQLSGGLRQRVMIAMALMCEPEVIIADEPTTALDVTVQAQILHLLKDLQRETGVGLLLITHDLGIVARIADRVAVMYAGEIVEQALVAQLFERPAHPYTRGLLDCIPVPGRIKPGERLGTIPGNVGVPIGGLPGCQFRYRCPRAADLCATRSFELRELGGSRLLRCRLEDTA